MSYLEKLRANKEKNLQNLVAALNPKSDFADDDKDFWRPTPDKNGNAYAVIRFLPAPEGEDIAIVKYFTHEFKIEDTQKWYIQRSRTSLGEGYKDPVAVWNKQLWDAGLQDQSKKQKRKMKYVANIYVISDPNNKDAEGKVWKYRFGPKIKDFINQKLKPEFPGDQPVDVFDIFDGANFILKQRVKDGFPNFDLCSFEKSSEFLDGNEEAIEAVLKQLHSLQAEIAEDKFKSYEQLERILNKARGLDAITEPTASEVTEAKKATKKASTKKKIEVDPDEETPPFDVDEGDEPTDEETSFFSQFKELVDKND